VATEGVDGLKLKAIADEIGIQVPSLYKQFDGREAILRALSEKYVADLATQFDFDELTDPQEVLIRGVRGIVELYALHPAWTRLQMRDYSSAEGVEALSRYTGGLERVATEGPLKGFATRVREILDEGARIGVFREVLVADFINVLLGSLSFKIVWLGGKVPHKKEIERLQDMMVDVILRFVRP
jgi:AcrR family transcriptional regulator